MDTKSIIKKIADRNGFPISFDGSPEAVALLSEESRIHLVNAFTRHVVANPEKFKPDTVSQSQSVVNAGGIQSGDTFDFPYDN